MNAGESANDLRAAGANMWTASGTLEMDAPVGLVTDQVQAALQHLKPAILDLLDAEAAAQRRQWAQARLCVGCQRFALSRPGLLCYWCRDRRTQAKTSPSQAMPGGAR
jgi:hypothetical protein